MDGNVSMIAVGLGVIFLLVAVKWQPQKAEAPAPRQAPATPPTPKQVPVPMPRPTPRPVRRSAQANRKLSLFPVRLAFTAGVVVISASWLLTLIFERGGHLAVSDILSGLVACTAIAFSMRMWRKQ